MKNKIICLFVGMLLFVTVFAVGGNKTQDFNTGVDVKSKGIEPLAIWDIQFNYDVDTPSGGIGIAGAECGNGFFLVSEWGYSSKRVFKFDLSGNYIGSWIPSWTSGTSGLRDMAFDGTYFYGGDAQTNNKIYCFDEDGNLITSWTTPSAVRSIAYDSDHDAFWVNNWQTNLVLVDRSGSVLYTIPTPPSMYGSAWEKMSEGTPVLWIFTGTTTGGPCQVEKYVDLYTGGTNQGIQHSVSGDFGATGIAGGLFYTEDVVPGYGTLGGLMQYSPDILFGYELCTTNFPPNVPSTPVGPEEGKTGIEYEFSSSTTDPESEEIYIKFDWGDGTFSDWLGPEPSGSTLSETHIWTDGGVYEVRAKAKDINGGESAWSDPHEIIIEEAVILEIREIGGKIGRITAIVKNIGTTNATDIVYTITLEGGLILLGKESTGTLPVLKTGVMADFQSDFIFGFGKPTITVKLEVEDEVFEKTATATVLLFFILNVA